MPQLRLLADDLTGALDTAAEFVGLVGPLEVSWNAAKGRHGSLAIDSGTRERPSPEAFAIVQHLAPMLGDATIAFKKTDSLLRGPWVAELDACLRSGLWDACIVAPAFPHQGRRTSAGQQQARSPDGGWQAAGDGILDQLARGGIKARLGRLDEALEPGVSVFDAADDEDLNHIVQIGRACSGRLLWCGSGGLAGALARGTDARASRTLRRPVLGVFGSDHAATDAQLARCGNLLTADPNGRIDVSAVKRRLADGVAFVRLNARTGSSRAEANRHFAQEIARLSRGLDPPGTLICAGGETLKAQCLAVDATALRVVGRIEPGLPRSVIEGGAWQGVDVVSKSGAFGGPNLWRDLLDENGMS